MSNDTTDVFEDIPNTMAGGWDDYSRRMDPTMPESLRNMLQTAFYDGAMFYAAAVAAIEMQHMNDPEAGIVELNALDQEMIDYKPKECACAKCVARRQAAGPAPQPDPAGEMPPGVTVH